MNFDRNSSKIDIAITNKRLSLINIVNNNMKLNNEFLIMLLSFCNV